MPPSLTWSTSLPLSPASEPYKKCGHNFFFKYVIFIFRPDIWFSVTVLKGLKVTSVPVLKKIIHSVVMDIFTTCKTTTYQSYIVSLLLTHSAGGSREIDHEL